MYQLHFLLKNLTHAEEIQKQLQQNGIHEKHIRFYSRNKNKLENLNIHSANFLEERDIVHMMLRGGLFSLIISFFIMLLVFLLNVQLSINENAIIAIFCTFFGAWLGGLIGFNNENYKISAYHDALLKGDSVLVIDTREEQLIIVQKTMTNFDCDILHSSSTSSIINPLEGWRPIHHPDD